MCVIDGQSSWFTSVGFTSWCHQENILETEWLSPRHWHPGRRMTQCSGIATQSLMLLVLVVSFFHYLTLSGLNVNDIWQMANIEAKYYNITITEHIMTNASFITTHLTLSRRFISTKESSVFFQELSSPSRMNNYKQIPLSSSQPSELVCGGRKTGKKSNLSLFYSISSPWISLPLNSVPCTALLATWNG